MLDLWESLHHLPGVGPVIGTVLSVGWLLYLVLLGGWVVLQKREPVATLSWLFALAFLPYLGFAIYYLLGPRRIERQRLRRLRSRIDDAGLQRDAAVADFDADAQELARLVQRSTGHAQSTARDVRLLVDGAAKYDAVIADIRAARHLVHLEYYIYMPDRTGMALMEALVDAARRGVKVRLLLDALGASRMRSRHVAELLAAGGELGWFHPNRFWRIWSRPWVNMRTHRKIVVIDNRIGYTGGINITDDENERLRSDAFRDLHLRLEGDVVRNLQMVFAEDWVYATGKRDVLSDIAHHMPQPEPADIAAQVVASGPDSSWEAIHRMYVHLIHAAKSRVWLVTPYFVPREAAMMALTSAALGGLDVRLLVPRRSDSLLVTLAARSNYDTLLAAGVKIYEYGPRMLHTKAILIDDGTAAIGTANFDHRSFSLNFEVAVLLQDRGMADAMARHLEGEFGSAPRVRDDRKRALLTARLPEALARLMSPLL